MGRNRFSGSILLAMAFFSVAPTVLSDAKFDDASRLLQQLLQERSKAIDPTSRERVAQDIKIFLPREQQLLNEGILEQLNQRERPEGSRLAAKLTHILGDTGQAEAQTAAVLTLGGSKSPIYAVAYAIPWCAVCSRSWLGVFGAEDSKQYRLIAKIEDPFPNRLIGFIQLPSQRPGETLFLYHGVGWGDPHNQLMITVYSFDGQELKSLFTRSGLTQGQVRTEGGKIELNFLTVARGPGYPPAPERTEIYRLTPSGIKLEQASEKKRS